MRPWPIAFVLLLAAPVALAHGDTSWPPGNHSEHVADFFWEPREPARGQPITATLTLKERMELDGVAVRVCRVENYACRAPIEMHDLGREGARPQYGADISWDGRFYKGVTDVGIAVILQFPNGTVEESPTEPWPGPAELPEGAGTYYFYDLPPDSSDVPAPGAAIGLLVIAVLLWGRK